MKKKKSEKNPNPSRMKKKVKMKTVKPAKGWAIVGRKSGLDGWIGNTKPILDEIAWINIGWVKVYKTPEGKAWPRSTWRIARVEIREIHSPKKKR